jgi:hypothetical protein
LEHLSAIHLSAISQPGTRRRSKASSLPGTQHLVDEATNSEGRRSAAVVKLLPDGNRPANATQFAKHPRLSQSQHAASQMLCHPFILLLSPLEATL